MQACIFQYKMKYSNSAAHYKDIGGSATFQRGNNKPRKKITGMLNFYSTTCHFSLQI